MLCCIFNYAPLYRQSVYSRLDEEYDVQFYFGRGTGQGQTDGIERLDYGIFRNRPKEFTCRTSGGRFPWYSGIWYLPFRRKYTAFLITGDFNWAWFPFLALCRLLGKKVYAWGHGLKKTGRYALLKRFYYNSLDAFFIYGAHGRDRMAELGFPAEKFHVIHNSLGGKVDRDANRRLASDIYRRHFGNGKPVLIFSGRLTEAKRLDMLVRAAVELDSGGCPCNLVIIGDGPRRRTLEDAGAGTASNVWLYGACYDESVIAEMQYNADLCVSPGNVGLSAIQSMKYGVPVISHDDFETQMPEYEAIVDGKTGTLFRKDDYADLKKKIACWLTSPVDREAIREECYNMIDKAWNTCAQMAIFREVLDV